MSVVVRLLFNLLHHSTSFTPSLYYHFSCPNLFYEKTILGLNKFIKILLKFYNCNRKGLFEVKVLTFHIAKTLTGKLYFKEAMVSLFQLPAKGKDY